MAINKVKYGNTTLIDLTADTVAADKLLTGYTAHDNSGTVITGTYEPDLVVTLTKNSNDEWEPDCTFAEVLAAYNAGKNIACTAGDYISAYITHTTKDGKDIFYLGVYPEFDESSETRYHNHGVDISWYKWGQEGFELDEEVRYYRTDMDDATPSDVLGGKHFHNANGIQTGTIPIKSSSDLTVSGATVTAPAGYYYDAASKSVATGSATTPATTITANPTISVNSSGLITATTSASQSITPTVIAGYVSSGIVGTVSVSGSNTQQLTTKGATTYTPSTTAQTIASGTYLIGTQTISGDSNLVAENIKKDVNIFGVTGTYGGGKTYSATLVDTQRYGTGGNSNYCYVSYPSSTETKYTNVGDSFELEAGQNIYLHVSSSSGINGIWINGSKIESTTDYTYSVPVATNVQIDIHHEYDDGYRDTWIKLTESQSTITITQNGTFDVSDYDSANVNVEGGSTINLQTKTTTPTESQQSITPDSGYDGLSKVTVNAISSTYVGTGVTRKAAATITPGTTNQTISSGTYLSGTQTIAGDADLVASNIKSGANIFGVSGSFTSDANAAATDILENKTAYVQGSKVTGTLHVITYYTGTTDPPATLGNDGDIYLKVAS